ncbi:MAG: hypothetical protein E7258_02755 [Lachnospiraceae bacterium]|nr:hypothetical protein [Lachnospiraceae bacterium]
MALKHVMINDIISEHSARMHNLKKYYPFFVLNETTFTQYKEGKFGYLDMGYITMASLRFFINENNFHEKDITFEEYEVFLRELLRRDFELEEEADEEKQLIVYIFDKLKNDGRAFEFKFYDPEIKGMKIARVKLIDSRIENGQVLYTITAEGIEFYLDTKEIKDESKISVSQLLLEKMISSNNFRGGIDVVKRINSQVIQLKTEKEQVLKLLGIDVFEGAKAYEDYMATTAKWFTEEQKLFAKNKALVDKAIERASLEKSEDGSSSLRSKALEDISSLETELKKTIYNHSQLIAETMELQQISDKIISRAKLRKLRPVFDFRASLVKIMEQDSPDMMAHVLMPLFAPRLGKSFSMKSIDNILTLKSEDKSKGEKVEKEALDLEFEYEDEILDKKIGMNFARLFYELLDQLSKWGKVTLKELNGILEIKFGEEIYGNRDYYSFLVHLAGKKTYSMSKMIQKQDTLLEEMVIQNMSEDDKERFMTMTFDIIFGEEEVELNSHISSVDGKEKESFYVTDMIFERRNGD